uniref:Uncharacterized protein n=1 Tax=Sphaerodactylus townsendi TaxID=933632 RepID=A0ACB8ELZ2_9SAUR
MPAPGQELKVVTSAKVTPSRPKGQGCGKSYNPDVPFRVVGLPALPLQDQDHRRPARGLVGLDPFILASYNGVTLEREFRVHMDAAGDVGFGIYFDGLWSWEV